MTNMDKTNPTNTTTLPIEIEQLAVGVSDEKRKEKNASDVEKLQNLAISIANIQMPDVNSDESKKLCTGVNLLLIKVINHINLRLQNL